MSTGTGRLITIEYVSVLTGKSEKYNFLLQRVHPDEELFIFAKIFPPEKLGDEWKVQSELLNKKEMERKLDQLVSEGLLENNIQKQFLLVS